MCLWWLPLLISWSRLTMKNHLGTTRKTLLWFSRDEINKPVITRKWTLLFFCDNQIITFPLWDNDMEKKETWMSVFFICSILLHSCLFVVCCFVLLSWKRRPNWYLFFLNYHSLSFTQLNWRWLIHFKSGVEQFLQINTSNLITLGLN